MDKSKLSVKDITELAILTAILFVGKELMNSLPNIHPVMLFVVVEALIYGYKSLLSIYTFSLLELIIYGFNVWNSIYLYIWPLATLLAVLLSKKIGPDKIMLWALFGGLYGLIYGFLSLIPMIFLSGFKATIDFWFMGIGYDMIHAASNFFIVLILLKPVYSIVKRLRDNRA